MRRLPLVLVLILAGCGVESTFVVNPKSGIPPGLSAELEGQETSRLRVEIWFYTNDPVTLKVFDAAGKLILERQGTWRSPNLGDHADLFVTVNGIETGYFQPAKGRNNLVDIVQGAMTHRTTQPATQSFEGT